MGTIKDLNSLQFSVSDPVEMEGKGTLAAGIVAALCNNQEGDPVIESNSPTLCSNTCPNDTSTSHPLEISAGVGELARAEIHNPGEISEQAMDVSKEHGQEESSGNFGSKAAEINTEIDQNRKETIRLDMDSTDPSADVVPFAGLGQETRRTETDHNINVQHLANLAEVKKTKVNLCVQPVRNIAENGRQSERENEDLGTVVCCSHTSMSTSTSQDAEVQVAIQVQSRSIATSPMAPLDNCPVFRIPEVILRDPPVEKPTACPPDIPSVTAPPKKDVQMQVDITVQCRSVATGPMTPLEKTPLPTLPEVCVEAMEEDEPVREVQWDEKDSQKLKMEGSSC
ncbi:G protein regulated inducer of neurite outgrowth 1 isoform X2 [Rhinoraja longicauda]